MSFEENLIKDGEIRKAEDYWYAVYEFQTPLSIEHEKVAKRALLYKLMEFLENSEENEFSHKIIVHRDFRQTPDFLGRNKLHLPTVGLLIQTNPQGRS